MAKIALKNEKITAFGGINFVLDKFDALLGDVIDRSLGIRSTSFGYQYSEIVRALFAVYLCGGDCMEDINLYLRDALADRPGTRIPSSDTVLRSIEELATDNVTYTAPKSGKSYDFNTAEKLNRLLVELLLATGQLVFDRQNNDFGWAHLPKSFMNQNTVFLMLTAMAANFYLYIVSLPLMCLFGVEAADRV